jgi:hypothetical protein
LFYETKKIFSFNSKRNDISYQFCSVHQHILHRKMAGALLFDRQAGHPESFAQPKGSNDLLLLNKKSPRTYLGGIRSRDPTAGRDDITAPRQNLSSY